MLIVLPSQRQWISVKVREWGKVRWEERDKRRVVSQGMKRRGECGCEKCGVTWRHVHHNYHITILLFINWVSVLAEDWEGIWYTSSGTLRGCVVRTFPSIMRLGQVYKHRPCNTEGYWRLVNGFCTETVLYDVYKLRVRLRVEVNEGYH